MAAACNGGTMQSIVKKLKVEVNVSCLAVNLLLNQIDCVKERNIPLEVQETL